ncbi:bifunctional 2-polyprenyl-6-hydroxyphenol methylase/3-demethylubiquinol 3-O-methyltransferase UbiG [Reyranella sp. CPCC 100927]|uniref:class I SAM-dependent methyltransferase n=1 Tax=Reyranella sp. CPCC 100927 TaxID=2599616 RepID=UPI0011B3D5BE|nr:class I SAM-dependent methyltransferase [Reyranella sp. CPCC 100927]TWT15562.1 class I SAM-dependent methyltransferase [Reyranella sp. CPCC 100927]
MYEQTGRYYAFFGPHAVVTAEEERFLAHWTAGRRRALDFGAALCGPALALARLGLEVLAFEPSPVLAAIAMDRLNGGDEIARNITLVEGSTETFAEPYAADVILMRSVLMLLDDTQRATALAAVCRHAAPDARLIVDVRTSALAWADRREVVEERRLGHTTFRRRTLYSRDEDDATIVQWAVDADRFGRVVPVAQERFVVRADTPDSLRALLAAHGFEVEQLHGAYETDRQYADGDEVIVAVAARHAGT